MTKKRLGRGLDALLSERVAEPPSETAAPASRSEHTADNHGIETIAVADIRPSMYQPRRHFDEQALAELADSIKRRGLLQPVVVRSRPQGGFELIAGERRWRAAQQAGLTTVPAITRTVTDEEASALALIENMQREDLTAIEEAVGLARLRDEFELTQQQIADAVGKSRVAIANLLRLLNLGARARHLLEEGRLEMGHARALLGLEGYQQDQMAQQVADQGLSVRQTEALVRRLASPAVPAKARPEGHADADTQRLAQRLTDHIGAPVSIRHGVSGKGEMVIRYSSLDELDGVLRHLGYAEEGAAQD